MTTNPKFIGVYQGSVGPIIVEDNFSRGETNRYVRRDVYQELVNRLNQYSIDHTNFAKENVKLQQKIAELESAAKPKGPQFALATVDIFRVGETYALTGATKDVTGRIREKYECIFTSNTSAVFRDEHGTEILKKQSEAYLWRKVIEKKVNTFFANVYERTGRQPDVVTHPTVESAEKGSCDPVARVKITYIKGQFDE